MTEKSLYTKSNLILIACAVGILILRFLFNNNEPDLAILPYLGERVSFVGEISKEADERDTTTRYTVDTEDSSSKILLVSNRFPKFAYGDRVEVKGKLELPKNFEGDTGLEFDYVSYLRKDRIHFIVYQPEIKLLEHEGNRAFKFLFNLKNYFANNISKVVPEPNSSLVGGLIFGTRQSIGPELLEKMKEVGLIHIVAISGYNVTIIAVAILSLTSYLRKRNLGLFLSAVSIVLFAIMVGLGSTVIRASIMAVIAILARYFGRPSDALRALFFAVFAMLLYNPLLLFYDPSFQLSVMATLGLILFSPVIYKHLSFVSHKFGLREIVASTFAVQIFLLPMLIKMSGILSLISFVINIFVLPVIPFAMLLGFLTGISGALSTFVSWPFGAVGYVITEFIIKAVEISSEVPFAFLQIGSLPTWLLIVWYAVYAVAFWKLSSITPQFKLEKKSST